MNNYEIQQGIIKAIDIVLESKLGQQDTTSSKMGLVVEDPKGFSCKVDIGGQISTCQLPEHLHTWIQKNDIVIVQDLFGNGLKKVVTGKTGSTHTTPTLVLHDEEIGRNVGSVSFLEDETGNKIDGFGTITQ